MYNLHFQCAILSNYANILSLTWHNKSFFFQDTEFNLLRFDVISLFYDDTKTSGNENHELLSSLNEFSM